MKQFPMRYSEEKSTGFWREINALKGKDHDAAYAMGVMLQNLEWQVLAFIDECRRRDGR